MAVKLYGRNASPFNNLVAFTLHEKDVDYEPVFCETAKFKTPEFLALNPFGQMPIFQDGDLFLYESRAIARYIMSKFEGQGTPLLGSNLREQAMVNQWTDVESHTFFPALWPICYELWRFKAPNQERIAAAMEKVNRNLDIYEERLSKSRYLAGDFFSFADLVHVPPLHFFLSQADNSLRSAITGRPHVDAWYKSLTARPGWQKILAIPDASDWSYNVKI